MKALNINKLYLPALTNIQIINSHFIERWHYRMLNDSKRNFAFKKAIGYRICQGYKTMLDIGCGSLILRSIINEKCFDIYLSLLTNHKMLSCYSLYAVEYPVNKIYACDYSRIMSKIASEVSTRNNMGSLIKILNINSNDLFIPDNIDER